MYYLIFVSHSELHNFFFDRTRLRGSMRLEIPSTFGVTILVLPIPFDDW